MRVIDFAHSYQFWTISVPAGSRHRLEENSARIQLDSRCEIWDEGTGRLEEFFLITPCRTEWMYREDRLFQHPNREYCVVASYRHDIRVGGGLLAEERRPIKVLEEAFRDHRFDIRHLSNPRLLSTDEEVIRATEALAPLVARTELRFPQRKWRIVLEYPIKTMNINRKHRRFQVDTGPIALPDPTVPGDEWIESFYRAFVAYNRFDRAEFVVERSTPLVADGVPVATVRDYQENREFSVQHLLYGGE